jgi:hypothetical protein
MRFSRGKGIIQGLQRKEIPDIKKIVAVDAITAGKIRSYPSLSTRVGDKEPAETGAV